MSGVPGVLDRLVAASARIRSATSAAEVRTALDEGLRTLPHGEGAEAAASELRATAASSLAFFHARSELAASVKARETLLASISHDLRNPLNTFAMSVGLIKDDLAQEEVDRARSRSLLERMERAVSRMQKLIEDLLEASRIEAGGLPLSFRTVTALELVEKAVREHEGSAQEKRAHLVTDVDAAVSVHGDRTRLTQALSKIVGYALKNVSEGGTVMARVQKSGAEVRFTVTGLVPGYRPEPIRMDEGRGGLSLLIARGLVAAHGGSLTVDTDDVTTYAFSLPSAS